LIKLFDEVEYIWPELGYPPLVTPYSQYVKNVALMNVTQMAKGKERWSMIADDTWDMLLGKSGKVPGPVSDQLKDMAKSQGREFYEGNPQDLYGDELEAAAAEMKENGWEFGADDEELFELAMHPEQYRAYKNGTAKTSFDADVAKRKSEKEAPAGPLAATITSGANGATEPFRPKAIQVDVNGEIFNVKISYSDDASSGIGDPAQEITPAVGIVPTPSVNGTKEILAPIEGNFMLTKNSTETPLRVGTLIKEGDLIGYIESMKVYNAIHADKSGQVVEICPTDGSHVDEDDTLIMLS